MSAPKVLPTRLPPTKRRELVDLGIKAGKSNRAIAKELGVDEKMIRLDRKFLATPVENRPSNAPRQKKPENEGVRQLSPERHVNGAFNPCSRWRSSG